MYSVLAFVDLEHNRKAIEIDKIFQLAFHCIYECYQLNSAFRQTQCIDSSNIYLYNCKLNLPY